jgi:hypothetical protein
LKQRRENVTCAKPAPLGKFFAAPRSYYRLLLESVTARPVKMVEIWEKFCDGRESQSRCLYIQAARLGPAANPRLISWQYLRLARPITDAVGFAAD